MNGSAIETPERCFHRKGAKSAKEREERISRDLLRALCVFAVNVLVLGLPVGTSATDDGMPTPTPTPAPVYGDTPAQYNPYGGFSEPYERFFLQPLTYRGYGRHLPEPENVQEVRIGFLGPIQPLPSVATGGATTDGGLGRRMLEGAVLAVEEANARGGYRGSGIPYRLVVRNDNGLWGASGEEIVHLAYREGVWAILGTVDGANTHIAIRVALKIEIPVVNTADTDPTLVETMIPWVFRNITDDRQMSYALADHVFGTLGLKRVAALRVGTRYGRVSMDELRDAATRLGRPLLVELQYRPEETDFAAYLERIRALEPDAVLTWGDAAASARILEQMRALGMNQWLIGSDRIVAPELLAAAGPEETRVVAASPWNPTRDDPRLARFLRSFAARFGEPPETYAAHAYDGTVMLLEAIERAGLNRARIRDELAAVTEWYGVTGPKRFDTVQTDRSQAWLATLERGRWVYRPAS